MVDSSISALPIELIEMVAGYLLVEDIRDLRLTCGVLEAKTLNAFGCRAFKSRSTDLSERSLSRINAMCRRGKFSRYVEDLAIVRGKAMGQGINWERASWGPLRSPARNPVIERFCDDLKHNLVNCRSFKFISRYPEGPAKSDQITVGDGLAVFLAVLARHQLDIRSIRIWFQNRSGRNIPIDMNRLPILSLQRPRVKSSWQHLRRLDLQLYLTRESAPLAMDLILNATNLQTLVLNLTGNNSPAGFMHELAATDPLPPIRDLRLSYIRLDAGCLMVLLANLGHSLHSLFLDQIYISPPSDLIWNDLSRQAEPFLGHLERFTLCHLRMTVTRLSALRVLSFPGLQGKSFTESNLSENCVLEDDCVEDTPGAVTGFRYEGPSARRMLGYLQDPKYHDPDDVEGTGLHIPMICM